MTVAASKKERGAISHLLKKWVGFGVFHAIRMLDRLLSVDALRWTLLPWAGLRALLPTRSVRWTRSWPGCLGTKPKRHPGAWSQRLRHHFDRVLAFLPDRLNQPRWRDRFEITGLDTLEAARAAGRPVILAFCHFGPFVLIPNFLRARGIPAVPLIAGAARNRPYIQRLKDRHLPFPNVPGALYTDQMREVVVLGTEAVLMMAVDVRVGRTVDVPLSDGWKFRMATGAIRMAARKRAVLLPCAALNLGPWRFRLEIGRPVPGEFLGPIPDVPRAPAHLVSELFPLQQAHPDHCCREVFGSRRKDAPPAPDPDMLPAQGTNPADVAVSLSPSPAPSHCLPTRPWTASSVRFDAP